jgi:murein DD-endopeptidase MepM/ murein hydrolase activator NlpD
LNVVKARLIRYLLLLGAVGAIALLPGSTASAVTPPPLPVPTPIPVPLPIAPPTSPPAAPPPAPSPVPTGPPAAGFGGVSSAVAAIAPGSSGPAALAAIGDPAAQAPGGDPAPPDPRFDNQQSPRELNGTRAQARELDRQQYVITAQIYALEQSTDAEQAFNGGGGSGKFGWPEHYRTISQPFGCTPVRLAPTSVSCSSGHFHTGDDIAGPDRTDVMAADTGVARVFRTGTGYGNYVIITHGQGWATLYGHLHDVVVRDGDLVQRGDLIAREGSTGNSTGPHLHFEVRKDGGFMDPCPFLEDCGRAPA